MKNFIVFLLTAFIFHSFAEEKKQYSVEVKGLKDKYKIQITEDDSEKITFNISDSKTAKSAGVSLNKVVFKLNRVRAFSHKNKDFLVVSWLKAPHGEWAFIYDLQRLDEEHQTVIKSYNPFEDMKLNSKQQQLELFGTTFMSMKKEDPVVKMAWKLTSK